MASIFNDDNNSNDNDKSSKACHNVCNRFSGVPRNPLKCLWLKNMTVNCNEIGNLTYNGMEPQ